MALGCDKCTGLTQGGLTVPLITQPLSVTGTQEEEMKISGTARNIDWWKGKYDRQVHRNMSWETGPPHPVIPKMLWSRPVLNTQSYLLTGADGRWHCALCAASLHLDRLWAFKHGRRLEVTVRQKGTELTLSERVLVKDFPFVKKIWNR